MLLVSVAMAAGTGSDKVKIIKANGEVKSDAEIEADRIPDSSSSSSSHSSSSDSQSSTESTIRINTDNTALNTAVGVDMYAQGAVKAYQLNGEANFAKTGYDSLLNVTPRNDPLQDPIAKGILLRTGAIYYIVVVVLAALGLLQSLVQSTFPGLYRSIILGLSNKESHFTAGSYIGLLVAIIFTPVVIMGLYHGMYTSYKLLETALITKATGSMPPITSMTSAVMLWLVGTASDIIRLSDVMAYYMWTFSSYSIFGTSVIIIMLVQLCRIDLVVSFVKWYAFLLALSLVQPIVIVLVITKACNEAATSGSTLPLIAVILIFGLIPILIGLVICAAITGIYFRVNPKGLGRIV